MIIVTVVHAVTAGPLDARGRCPLHLAEVPHGLGVVQQDLQRVALAMAVQVTRPGVTR